MLARRHLEERYRYYVPNGKLEEFLRGVGSGKHFVCILSVSHWRIGRVLARRHLEEKYRYYVPNGKLEEFLRGVGSGKHFVCILSAGNKVFPTGG